MENKYLLNKDVNFIREACSDPSDTYWGTPRFYAIFDENSMILGPTPNADYIAELHYYYYPESIVTVGNTWLGDNFDTALFYGSLLEAAAFMKEDADTVAQYSSRYQEAMALLQNLGEGKNRRDAPDRADRARLATAHRLRTAADFSRRRQRDPQYRFRHPVRRD